MSYTLHVAAHGTIAVFLFAVLVWIRRSTSGSAARWMVVVLTFDAVWVCILLAQLLAPLDIKKWLAPLAAGVGVLATIPWFLFAVHYTGRQQWLTRRRTYALWAVGGTVLLALATTNFHSILWTGYTVNDTPFLYVDPQMAPTVILIYAVAYAPALGGIVLLVEFLLSTRHLSRTQTMALVGGGAVGIGINLLSAIGVGGVGLASGFDYSGLATGIFGVVVGWSLFNDDLFRVAPVARDTIFESFSDPLIAVDVETAIVDYNAAATTVFPEIGTVMGEPIEQLEPALLDDGDFAEKLTRTVDGEDRSFRIEHSQIEAGDRQVGTVVHLRDVTELEAYAAELERKTDQLETKTDQLEEFASSVSHDLRNPINVAKGRIDVAKQTGEDEHLDTADEALDRGLETIEELLDLARSGQKISETEAVELSSVVEHAWSAVDTRDATLSLACEDTVVMADRGRLQGLFENLFRNAIEHVGEDVAVTVRSTEEGFVVGDDGPGIPEDQHDQVFEHGYTGGGGTGLGLAKVESIAIAHDWSVSIGESAAGGAQFIFENVTFESQRE